MDDIEQGFGYSGRERERLIRQADTFAPEASWLLDQVGVGPGWRVADFGCGPLGIMTLLSERVGATGHAAGLDNDVRMITRAQEIVSDLELGNVSLTLADAADTGLEPSSLDLVHARQLLIHTPHPEQVVAEMTARVRPGGTVALQEPDWVSWVCQPAHPAWDRLIGVLSEFAGQVGLDLNLGRRLPDLLSQAGLGEVSFRAVCPTYFSSGKNDNHTLLLTLAQQFSGPVVAAGLLTAGELNDLITQLDRHLAQPGTMTIFSLLCQAWARKPG